MRALDMAHSRIVWVRSLTVTLALGAVSLAVACGDDGGGGGPSTSGGSGGTGSSSGGSANDSGSGGNAGSTGGTSDGGACVRVPRSADAPRKVVISHPYDANQQKSDLYEVLALDAKGKLEKTGKTFQLGRSTYGEIVFTPDGELGFVATEEGKIGSFRVEPSGDISVLNPGFAGGFYASKLIVDPNGDHLYVIDDEWRDIGGGVYSMKIDCDGKLTEESLVAPAKLPAGLWFSAKTPGRALVAADDVLDSPSSQHLHVLDWSSSPKVVASQAIFAGDSPIISSLAVTADEKHALLGDNSAFSSVPNRVAVVAIDGTALSLLQELSPIEDPADIETSPFDSTALVSSGFGDALIVLGFDASKPSAPYSAKPLSYQGAAPQLPIDMVQIRRGGLTGHVLVSEVGGVRQVAFAAGKTPVDLGVFALGSGTENVPGALGVQP